MDVPKSFGLRKCGIYCITNIVNNKIYIGSSKNIYHRLKRHSSELKRKVHVNKYLQNSYLKHGPSNFKVSILEEVPYENLQNVEQWYINSLKPDYNITIEVIRNSPSLESRKKTSATLKNQKKLGILKYPTHDDKKKPVTIYDKNCNCIGHYESQREAAKKLKELYPDIKYAQSIVNSVINLRSKRKVKKYKQHYLLNFNEPCNNEKKFRADGIKIKVIDKCSDKEYIFPTLIEASRVLKCSESAVKRALMTSRLLLKKYKVEKYGN